MKIKSKNIKVYPTAYRGENTDVVEGTPVKRLYNPGSRLFTEENIGRPYINLINYVKDTTKTSGSFVLSTSKNDSPFKFVISGYYFEIVNSPSIFSDNTKKYYARINVQNKGTEDENNTKLYTNYLLPIENTEITTLDKTTLGEDLFEGLEILDALPQEYASDGLTYLLLVDEGNIPDTSLIKYSQYTVEGGEDKPLSKFLRTDDIKINNTLIDNKSPHDTEINFVNSSEKIKTVNATTSVTTPKVYTQDIDNLNTGSVFNLKSTKKITIEAQASGTEDGSLIQLKTTEQQANIELKTEETKSDINLTAADSVHIKAYGDGNTTGAYISLQAGRHPIESYVLPSTSDDEPSDFTTSHRLATREWINASYSNTGTGNDVVKFTIADKTYQHTVNNVAHSTNSQNSDTVTLNTVSSNTDLYYLILSKEATGSAKQVCKSGSTYIKGSTLHGSSIDFTGTIKGGTFNATSDIRLKENIVQYTPKKSILDLNVYEFNFKGQEGKHIGCIAQELQTMFPELVHEDDKGYLSIEETKLVYLLLDEVKKLRREVDELKK